MGRILFNKQDLRIEPEKKIGSGYAMIGNPFFKRSKKYLDLISGLDHDALLETKGLEALKMAIAQEFGEAGLADCPIGIVAKCYLGAPFEVHTLDLSTTQIVQHFRTSESLPPDFEKARTLAKHNAYAFVEVYSDKMILVRDDGSTIKM